MEYNAQFFLDLQRAYNLTLEKLALLWKERFDLKIDIALLKVLFRENQSSIEELELSMFEQELAYTKLASLDAQISRLQSKIDLIDDALDNI